MRSVSGKYLPRSNASRFTVFVVEYVDINRYFVKLYTRTCHGLMLRVRRLHYLWCERASAIYRTSVLYKVYLQYIQQRDARVRHCAVRE